MPQIREQIAMVHLPPSKTLKYLFHVRKTREATDLVASFFVLREQKIPPAKRGGAGALPHLYRRGRRQGHLPFFPTLGGFDPRGGGALGRWKAACRCEHILQKGGCFSSRLLSVYEGFFAKNSISICKELSGCPM